VHTTEKVLPQTRGLLSSHPAAGKGRKPSERIAPYLLLLPPLLFLLSVIGYPLCYAVGLSVTNEKTKQFVGLHNFIRAMGDPQFSDALRAIAIYVVIVIATEFVLGLLLALLMTRYVKSGLIKSVFYSLFLMPLVTPPVAAGVLFRLMYTPSYGVVNYLLQALGLIHGDILWLTNPTLAMFSVMSVDVWQWTPFVFFVFYAGFQAVPLDAIEAAKVDGASTWQIFRHVELSYLKPLMLLVVLFRFADTFQVFDHVMVLTQGGPGRVTQFLSVYLYKVAFKFLNLNYAAAIAFFIILVAGIIFWGLNRLMRRAG